MADKRVFAHCKMNTTQITVHSVWSHNKASEKYLGVTFKYPMGAFEFGLPIEYRRTGLDLATKDEIREYLPFAYEACNPDKWETWKMDQKAFWDGKQKALVTRPFFDILLDFKWHCQGCQLPPNPNWARRTQDIKEFGYTLATKLKVQCVGSCGKKTTHLQLLPIPRLGARGYETWSPELRDRIIKVLKRYDAFEGRKINSDSLIPDHKFSEIRWDHNTKRSSLEDLTDEEIKNDFQLINNQRNQQKREVCRKCKQSGVRGYPLGIEYFYQGNSKWPINVAPQGKAAEAGCVGCGWYDLEKWRKSLVKRTSVIPS